MKKFTKEETMLMMLYNPGSREGLIRELAGMKVQLQPEEKKLAKLTDRVINKLKGMDDAEQYSFYRILSLRGFHRFCRAAGIPEAGELSEECGNGKGG